MNINWKESGTHKGTLIRNPMLNFTKVLLGTTDFYKLMAICYLNNLVTNPKSYQLRHRLAEDIIALEPRILWSTESKAFLNQ